MSILDTQKRLKGDISDKEIHKMTEHLEKDWGKADAEDCE
jgi:hypothetical protein